MPKSAQGYSDSTAFSADIKKQGPFFFKKSPCQNVCLFHPRNDALKGDLVGSLPKRFRVRCGESVSRRKLGRGSSEQRCVKGADREITAVGAGVRVVRAPKPKALVLDGVRKRAVDIDTARVQGFCGGGKVLVKEDALIKILVAAEVCSVRRSDVERKDSAAFVYGITDLFACGNAPVAYAGGNDGVAVFLQEYRVVAFGNLCKNGRVCGMLLQRAAAGNNLFLRDLNTVLRAQRRKRGGNVVDVGRAVSR